MKKNLLISLLCVSLLLTGCGKEDSNDDKSKNDNNKSSYTFTDLEKDLKQLNNDLEVKQKSAEMIGATEGYGYISENCSIEVYKFDTSSDKYKDAEKNQQFNIESLNMKMKATVKNGYGYYINDDKSSCDEEIKLIEKLMK